MAETPVPTSAKKTQSLLKIKPLHHFASVNPSKFLSTGFVREEFLPHFTPSEGAVIWGVSTVPVAHTAGDSCLTRRQSPACEAPPSPSKSPPGRSVFRSAFVNVMHLSADEPTQTSVFADAPIAVHSCEVNGTAPV